MHAQSKLIGGKLWTQKNRKRPRGQAGTEETEAERLRRVDSFPSPLEDWPMEFDVGLPICGQIDRGRCLDHAATLRLKVTAMAGFGSNPTVMIRSIWQSR